MIDNNNNNNQNANVMITAEQMNNPWRSGDHDDGDEELDPSKQTACPPKASNGVSFD